MIKELGQMTPRQLLDKFSLRNEKPKPDSSLAEATIDQLPIDVKIKDGLTIAGSGDWTHSISSGGSLVVANGDRVFKFPLGRYSNNSEVLNRAAVKKSTATNFKESSPSTDFFIARLDGPDSPPKVVIFQHKVNGEHACDTPFKKLISPNIALQLKEAVNTTREVLHACNLLDQIGLRLNTSTFIKSVFVRLILALPWFSDNIMIDENDKVWIVDNAPDERSHYVGKYLRKKLQDARLIISGFLVDLTARFNNTNSDTIHSI